MDAAALAALCAVLSRAPQTQAPPPGVACPASAATIATLDGVDLAARIAAPDAREGIARVAFAEAGNHVWSYDFVEGRTHEGKKFRMLCLIDEFTREALAIRVKRKLNSTDVLETLADVMICRGTPDYIRSDNGPEFIATTLREWIADVGGREGHHLAEAASSRSLFGNRGRSIGQAPRMS